MADKKSFIVYFDKRDMFEELLKSDTGDNITYERVGRLFMALCDFAEHGKSDTVMDFATTIAYKSIIPQIQSDQTKYDKRCARNRENINKRWNTTEYNRIQSYTDTVTDMVYICSGENAEHTRQADTTHKKTPVKRFSKPTIEEVQAYCNERANGIDVQRWFDYYESIGWKIGKNHMKDWKASVRTWEKQAANAKPITPPAKKLSSTDEELYKLLTKGDTKC